MKRFSEIFSFKQQDIQEVDYSKKTMRLSDLGAVGFGTGVTDKKAERTPHYEIDESLKMFELNPIVNSALNQLILFLFPNKDVKIASHDPETVSFLEKWHKQREGIVDEYRNILLTNVICGNGYMEKSFAKTVNNEPVLNNIFSINDAARIYVDPDRVGGDGAFIFELPVGIKQFRYMGDVQYPDFVNIQYIKNYQYTFRRVYGFRIPDFKIGHYSSGWSRDNLYGRSMLTSAIDANNVYMEIISGWDTIAKTKQIDQKILSVADSETGMSLTAAQKQELRDELEDESKSYMLFTTPLKMVTTDIKTSGNYDLMEGVFDIVRRVLMMALLPQHLTPWSDSATTQGSDSAMPPFLGRIKAKQNEFISYLNREVIDLLRETYPWLAEDATFVIDEPKIMSHDYYIRQISDLINTGVINENQAREYLKKLGVLDKDILEIEEVKSRQEFEKIKEEKVQEMSEAIKADVGFETFKRRLKARDKNINSTGWKQLNTNNIGGKIIRLIRTDDENIVLLFDGLRLVETFNLENIEMKTVNQAYEDYKKKLKDMQDEFEDGDTTEDLIIDEMEKEVKKLLDKNLDRMFKSMSRSTVKKEGFEEKFLSSNILDKISGFFKDFNKDVKKIIDKTMTKLGLVVTSDDVDKVTPTSSLKDKLKDKNNLIKRNIVTQVKQTKDKMLADIKSQISNGIAAGKSAADIRKEVEQSFNYNDGVGWKFKRLLNTETRNATSLLKLKKWQQMGYETFEWITKNDSKVRPSHQAKNRRVFSIDKALNAPADDYDAYAGKAAGCRCTMIPYS